MSDTNDAAEAAVTLVKVGSNPSQPLQPPQAILPAAVPPIDTNGDDAAATPDTASPTATEAEPTATPVAAVSAAAPVPPVHTAPTPLQPGDGVNSPAVVAAAVAVANAGVAGAADPELQFPFPVDMSNMSRKDLVGAAHGRGGGGGDAAGEHGHRAARGGAAALHCQLCAAARDAQRHGARGPDGRARRGRVRGGAAALRTAEDLRALVRRRQRRCPLSTCCCPRRAILLPRAHAPAVAAAHSALPARPPRQRPLLPAPSVMAVR
eukprot:TRINITY_DN2316_c0_g1_i1.p1 TRINITY_DN2316_c0_g1~~TRINITY_DN2316_c0_g1_i1.p1  ORF type:complete len:278 (+),score=58.87 TRINITY_DN2316_c0_g1_i1:41-835(+)